MAEVTKIPAGELIVGDHYAPSKSDALDGKHYPVTEIHDGETSRRIALEGHGNIRPRRTTEVWVMLANDDPRLAGAASPDEMDGERPPTIGTAASTDEELARTAATLKDKRGITIDTVELDGEQMTRAIEVAAGGHAGLRNAALKSYILTGSSGAREAKAAREATKGTREPTGPKPGSMTSAMLEVLRGRRKGMTAKEITEQIMAQGLAPNLKGKTPDATVGAKLSTEAKKTDGLFERTEPGRYKARAGASA